MRISKKKTILKYVLNALLALSVIPKHTYFSSTCPNLNFIVKTFSNTLQSFVKWRGGSLFWYLYPTPISLCLLALEVCATVLGHSFACDFSYRLVSTSFCKSFLVYFYKSGGKLNHYHPVLYQDGERDDFLILRHR